MLWIALHPNAPSDACTSPHDARALSPEQQALAWWALQFGPRVCALEEAVLLEAHSSLRLFGGQRALLQRLRSESARQGATGLTVAPTALAALALLRSLSKQTATDAASGSPIPARACSTRTLVRTLDALPLPALSASIAHQPTLQLLGCHTLGQLRALPRGGISRRFGSELLNALDCAYGLRSESYDWIALPEQFNQRLEFNSRIEVAQALLFGAGRLLTQLSGWLLARQRGVLALQLHWEHDLVRRGDAAQGCLTLRTALATRDMSHLARLLGENLARTRLSAPVIAIRLDASQTEPLATSSTSLLPDDVNEGESLLQLTERLSARLGTERVLRGQLLADHRPQHMQAWQAATRQRPTRKHKTSALPAHLALQPPWILRQPLRLAMHNEQPVYQGPLTLLAGPDRLETGWWSFLTAADDEGDELNMRDYYVAQSPYAGLLWVYRRRSAGEPGWFLHGIYG